MKVCFNGYKKINRLEVHHKMEETVAILKITCKRFLCATHYIYESFLFNDIWISGFEGEVDFNGDKKELMNAPLRKRLKYIIKWNKIIRGALKITFKTFIATQP